MKVRLRLCDEHAVGMIRQGFDVTHLVSYHPTKGSNCNAEDCEYRGYPRVYFVEVHPVGVLVDS